MTAPTQIDADWDTWTFEDCIVCGEPAIVHGYVRTYGPAMEGIFGYRPTWVRAGWCKAAECQADRVDTTYIPRERAAEIAANLAAAVHRAEREARE